MTIEQLNQLEAQAGDATQGPWGCGISYVILDGVDGDIVVQDWSVRANGMDVVILASMQNEQKEKNATYIAAANPATVKALVKAIKKMAVDTARWQATHTSLSCNITANCILQRTENIITEALQEAGE